MKNEASNNKSYSLETSVIEYLHLKYQAFIQKLRIFEIIYPKFNSLLGILIIISFSSLESCGTIKSRKVKYPSST